GEWAAVILIICRLVQGFATGGEYGTSATYLSEAAVPKHRGFLASFHYVTLVGGHVLAQALFLALLLATAREALADWGWRLAFLVGGGGAVVGRGLGRTRDEARSEDGIEIGKKTKESGSVGERVRHYGRERTAWSLAAP